MTPTVGRIVHVAYSGMIYLGLVTYVWSDTCVNLALFSSDGDYVGGQTSLVYNEDRVSHLTWSWPPRVS